MRLSAIEHLTTSLFAKRWQSLFSVDAMKAPDLRYPGVYLIGYSRKRLAGLKVDPRDVLYVGMTCSTGGLRERVRDFSDGIERNKYHSGATRFFRDEAGGKPFSKLKTSKKLFFVSESIPCNSKKSEASPSDFRELGHVACLEYYAIARVLEKTGRKPPLNKLGASPKSAVS